MTINTKDKLTDSKRFFLEPSNSAQRQYEALRAFFIEELPSAEAAKVQLLNLKPRMLRTKFGGLFLFLPLLAKIPLEDLLQKADFPGSKKIPADYAMRSLLALKLFGNSRHSHVMSYVFDEGLALWAGLNVI